MSKVETGDKGQRYEVSCLEPSGKKITIGWADTQEGVDNLVLGVNLHPSMHSPKVIDRKN